MDDTDPTQESAEKYNQWKKSLERSLDPLLALYDSGKHIWADEHADEYVANLRKDWD